VTCPECQSTRVRALLPLATDDRPAYICRDCQARWQAERRSDTPRYPLKYGERRIPDKKPKKLG